jgi:serine/threonine protein kinase
MKEFEAKTVFQAAVLASQLVTSQQLMDCLSSLGEANRSDDHLAKLLIRRGHLTEYQATQLKQGRTKFTLGSYLITDYVGQGGMGRVYKGVHQVMGRICAVKILPMEKATEEARLSFIREIRLQAGLECPYLVRAYDAGQDGSIHYMVTEYVPGQDLGKLVKSQGKLTQQHAASVIMQTALGLDYAHRQGLIHRDVKPGNILVTPDGRVKVSDVGLAAWSTSVEEDPRAGKVVGTADYLSPEQIRTPLEVTILSDLYSLGCTLYYSVCGKPPYPGGDSASKCKRHCEATPWHPRKYSPELSEDFVDIIAELMDKDPARRIGNAAEVAARLEPYTDDSAPWMPPQPSSEAWTAPPPADPVEFEEFPKTTPEPPLPMSDPVPPVPPIELRPIVQSSSSSFALSVLLALGIPLSLLAGAIFGFWLRGRM